jgi:hypothetical protein
LNSQGLLHTLLRRTRIPVPPLALVIVLKVCKVHNVHKVRFVTLKTFDFIDFIDFVLSTAVLFLYTNCLSR